MRLLCLAGFGPLLFAAMVAGQQPAAAPREMTALEKEARLDVILDAWEKRMSQVETISLLVTQKHTEVTRGSVEIMEGVANLKKPNQALLHLAEKSNPGNFKRYLSTGAKLYEFIPRDKQIVEHDIPKGASISDNLFFSILSGIKAKDARQRFVLKYLKEEGPYAYIDLYPKFDADKQEFTVARLIIVVDGQKFPGAFMLPRQIYYIAPNKDTYMYDLEQIVVNKPFDPKNFTLNKPADWTLLPAIKPAAAAVPGNAGGPSSLMKGIKEKQ